MNKGLEILFARLHSHPEEFDRLFRHRALQAPTSGWDNLVSIVLDKTKSHSFVSEEERSLFEAKMLEVQGHLFAEAVMRTLFELNDDSCDAT